MGRNRFLTVRLALSLSILFSGLGRAEDKPFDFDPACRAVPGPEPWLHPVAAPACLGDAAEEAADVITVDGPATPDTAPRDPWAILQTTPGVLSDRVTVGSATSGCSSPALIREAQAAVGQGFFSPDEMIATDMAVAGSLLSELDFDVFTETPVETGGADLVLAVPQAPRSGLSPRRGTNEWQGAGSLQGSGGGEPDGGVDGHQVESIRSGSAQIGGPLAKDQLWVWGEAGFHQVDRTVLGGQKEERAGRSGRFKLNSQIGTSASFILAGSRGNSEGSRIGAGPGRAPETTWNEDGREAVWAAEGTVIANSDFYCTASVGQVDRRLGDLPRLAGAEARIGPDGVARGSWFGLREEQRTRQAKLFSTVYATTRSAFHEIGLGAGWRREDEDRALNPPGPLVVAGRIFGLPENLALAELWQAGQAGARTEDLGLWAQDKVSAGDWTAAAGLQADRQDLGTASGQRPWALLPRLGLNWAPGPERITQIWASLARFASPLGPRAAWHLDAGAPAVLRSLFEDRNGDLSLDPGERVRVLSGEGLDPLRPGIDPDAVDPRLRPEIADEAVLGVQHSWSRDFHMGLRVSWRQTRHLLEERLLVRDVATNEVFSATAGDWIPAGRLTGILPDGTPYDVPVWDLRPALLWTGGTLLVNGDRRQEAAGVSLTWQKVLSSRWMSVGHVTWRDASQRLGPAFRRFDDPTNALVGGDDESRPVVETASGRPHDPARFMAVRWSFHALGAVVLHDRLTLSAAVNGRQGDPLPYYRQVARERAGVARVQLTGRPDAYRTDDLVTVDAQLEKEFTIGDAGLTLSLEVSNLLNEDTVLQRELDLGTGRAALAGEALASRTLRLKARMSWW